MKERAIKPRPILYEVDSCIRFSMSTIKNNRIPDDCHNCIYGHIICIKCGHQAAYCQCDIFFNDDATFGPFKHYCDILNRWSLDSGPKPECTMGHFIRDLLVFT